MIIIELEDVQRVSNLWKYERDAYTRPELTPDENWEAMQDDRWFDEHPEKRYYPGPYLIRVNDEDAWLGRGREDDWEPVAKRMRQPGIDQRQWAAYFDLYAAGIGITTSALRNRFMGMRRRLRRTPNQWEKWDKIYTWPEGSEEVWDSIYNHPWLETQELEGMREVRYVSK